MNSFWVAGVDEAGRGPWAGPVVAASVILNPDKRILGLADSKKLSEKKREALYEPIFVSALSVGVGIVSAEEIDCSNILEATFEAMRRAIASLKLAPHEIWIDGNQRIPGIENQKTFVGGDALHECIMAASIIAKVTRDRKMLEYEQLYSGYEFARHKGYGTALHIQKLETLGPCPIHRMSFAPLKTRFQSPNRT